MLFHELWESHGWAEVLIQQSHLASQQDNERLAVQLENAALEMMRGVDDDD